MMRSGRRLRFGPIVALLTAAVLLLGGCAGRETAGRAAQTALVREQVAPALRLARAARAAHDLDSAVSLYRSVVAAEPSDAMLAVEFADTLLEAGSFDAAIDAYGRVDGTPPARIGALLGLTRAHLALGEPQKALDYADRAQTLAHGDTRAFVARGVALDSLGRHAEAQASYRAALAAAPHDVAARNNLALSLAFSGRFPEAIEILTPMARSTTATPRIRQNLALVYGLMGDSARAADLSRIDLDKTGTEGNLRFFAFVRGEDE